MKTTNQKRNPRNNKLWHPMLTSANRQLILLAPSVALLAACTVQAAVISWTNTAGGNWSVASNWKPNQMPGVADDVVITASGTYTVALNVDATVASFSLGGGSGTNALLSNGHNLTVTNSGTINARGVLR